MRLLLINPRFPESFWSFKWALTEILPKTRALNPPLGLATLAALCPDHWQVEIIDENIESIPLEPEADIVGVCGMGVQFPRQSELLAYYRQRGYRVVAGGSYASLCPEKYTALADSVIAGEAEYIWPQFCRDCERGAAKALYRETGTVDLAHSPTPRFDLLALERYSSATLQFSRGCPFRCDFCDIIVMFGRKPRVKGLAQVERELDALHRAGSSRIFFVDDNLIGHRPRAKELLRFIADYQRKHGFPFSFGTEASLDLAGDTELLALFRAAGFAWVFIGIESPDPASLAETHKTQNLKADMLESLARIHAHGLEVLGGFIVGFDNDTAETFELQYDFIMASGIQTAMVGLLTALPRTPLHARLAREGRLRESEAGVDNTGPATNVAPKRMAYEEMIAAYTRLYRRLLSDRGIAGRIRSKTRYFRPSPAQARYSLRDGLGILRKLFVKGILPGGPWRMLQFLRSVGWPTPARLQWVAGDWIVGLSMRKFAETQFADAAMERSRLEARLGAMERALKRYMWQGKIAISAIGANGRDLTLVLRLPIDRRLARRTGRSLHRLLHRTRARITLHIPDGHAHSVADVRRLLDRLSRYGDRVFLVMGERLRGLAEIDSSVFNLVMAAPREMTR